ncbi:rod shape-determining protein [Veillonella sp. CHU110]|uniref:rod shape-determining protein n=1 Tax=Veillonella sp. CHU110 TaxID=2490947 RepID=UPI000F8CADAF|nr:rod shape-determining protein [Veillonella sp. CHU110]
MLTLFGWTSKRKESNTQDERRKQRRVRRKPLGTTTKQTSLKREPRKLSFLEKVALLWTTDIGIDLGTTNIVMYVKGRGIVLDEPGFVACDTKTREVIAVGHEARTILGRTPDGIEVIQPLKGGVIADYDTTAYMLRHFIRRVIPISGLVRCRIVACVPSSITPVEKRAVLEVLLQAGAKKIVLMEEPLAAAIGTGLDKAEQVGAMVVDIGGGTTDIAVICDSGVVVSESLRTGSDDFDTALLRYMKRKKKLLIGPLTAEDLKIEVGTVDPRSGEERAIVRGRHTSTGLPRAVEITSKDMKVALERPMQMIIEGIVSILEKTPPELLAQINDHGIILTGGGALLRGLDRMITERTGRPAYVVEHPRYSVILGTGKALSELNQLRDTLEELR